MHCLNEFALEQLIRWQVKGDGSQRTLGTKLTFWRRLLLNSYNS
jgi:hypothetical protein